jgi:DNA-binding PadR family transcriptional regulator|nr:PadR family transcriptional regulator [Candidatus Krumholzibacteria bacterium]
MSVNRELIAASTTPLVLAILSEGDGYGYALIKRVKDLSGDRIAWSDGMLYPVLRRLETQKLISSYWQVAETGRRRRYYALKPAGLEELNSWREQWTLVGDVLNRLWPKEPKCST